MLFGDISPVAPRLIGIARLAAGSSELEHKRRVEYRELASRRWIGRASGHNMPFEWTINPYRGCEYGCVYCYARYTHEFMELPPETFEERIFAKRFEARAFEAELRKIPCDEGICIGSATDPYQPAERRFRLTRSMLEVFARHEGRRFSITTKSDLVARDAELLGRIAAHNVVHVYQTITTVDARLARVLEPFAPRPDLRLKATEALAKAGVRVAVLASPVLPLINDSEASLSAVAEAAAGAGARYLAGGVLFLKPCAQKIFFPFLEREYPELVRRYKERFEESAYLRGAYPEMIAERIRGIRKRFGLEGRPSPYPIDLRETQLALF